MPNIRETTQRPSAYTGVSALRNSEQWGAVGRGAPQRDVGYLRAVVVRHSAVRKLGDEHRHCVGPGVRDVVRWGEVWANEGVGQRAHTE